MIVCDVTLSVYPNRASLKNMPATVVIEPIYRPLVRFPPWPGIFFKLARFGYTLRVTSQTITFMTCFYCCS
jgi:hypothetical protein